MDRRRVNDADRVRAIERKAELRLLAQLLEERTRPIPRNPEHKTARDETVTAPRVSQQLRAVMRLLAASFHDPRIVIPLDHRKAS